MASQPARALVLAREREPGMPMRPRTGSAGQRRAAPRSAGDAGALSVKASALPTPADASSAKISALPTPADASSAKMSVASARWLVLFGHYAEASKSKWVALSL
jgi:hypothetical protein